MGLFWQLRLATLRYRGSAAHRRRGGAPCPGL